jgi:hypothetical protein
MQKQYQSDGHITRSGTRIRQSVRCLPTGHFQQIRQMFDKQISERQQKQKVLPSHVLLKLPVTDDEKLQHTTTNIDDILIENEKLFEEQFHSKFLNQSLQQDEQLLKPILSLSNENHFHTGNKKKKDLFLKERKQMQSSD